MSSKATRSCNICPQFYLCSNHKLSCHDQYYRYHQHHHINLLASSHLPLTIFLPCMLQVPPNPSGRVATDYLLVLKSVQALITLIPMEWTRPVRRASRESMTLVPWNSISSGMLDIFRMDIYKWCGIENDHYKSYMKYSRKIKGC